MSSAISATAPSMSEHLMMPLHLDVTTDWDANASHLVDSHSLHVYQVGQSDGLVWSACGDSLHLISEGQLNITRRPHNTLSTVPFDLRETQGIIFSMVDESASSEAVTRGRGSSDAYRPVTPPPTSSTTAQ